jgi:hypothetical protein
MRDKMAGQAASGANSNPRNTEGYGCLPRWIIGVVIVLAFPRSKSGIFDLTLKKIEHFSKVSFF